jgi:regulator of replication initiation timing
MEEIGALKAQIVTLVEETKQLKSEIADAKLDGQRSYDMLMSGQNAIHETFKTVEEIRESPSAKRSN